MKRVIYAGVRKQDENFIIDYTYNYPEDIIDVVSPQLYSTTKHNHTYYFGYRFKDTAPSTERTEFIHSVKQIGDNPLSDDDLEQFIDRPLAELNNIVNLYHLDCFVYPISNRSPLVSKMIRCINKCTSREMNRCSFEFVKRVPTEIGFDFSSFEADYGDTSGYRDMVKHVKNQLIPKLRNLDYFSIAQNVKSRYRPYITGFLDFKNPEDIEQFSKLKGSNILVIDDINTTGSTLEEILRKLNRVNDSCNIFIYTLIGK